VPQAFVPLLVLILITGLFSVMWRTHSCVRIRQLGRRLKNAKLRTNACVEEIDYRGARGLDKSAIRALAQESAWVGQHENVFVLGPTGVGKSFVACALAQKLAAMGIRHSTPAPRRYSGDLAMARADGRVRSLLARLCRIDVLVIDDWVMGPLSEPERRDF
jgi:DNA replication protein DnaC